MFPRPTSMLLAAIFCRIPSLTAQDPSLRVVPRVGQSVSVPIPYSKSKVMGRLTHISSDSMVIEMKGQTVILGSRLLDSAMVVTGRTSAAGPGLIIGSIMGGALGALAGATLIADGGSNCTYCGLEVAAYGAGGLVAGALLGATIGALASIEVWSRATAPGALATSFDGDLTAGDIVRFVGGPGSTAGVVTGGEGGMARIQRASGSDTVVALSSVERYVGERISSGKGRFYGAVIGAALGGIVAAVEGFEGQVTGSSIAASAALGGLVGAGVGTVVARKRRPTWRTVGPAPKAALSVLPVLSFDRVGVAARLIW